MSGLESDYKQDVVILLKLLEVAENLSQWEPIVDICIVVYHLSQLAVRALELKYSL